MEILGVYIVNFGTNVGGEINEIRPAIVISDVSTKDNTLLVVPLTSKKPGVHYRGGFTIKQSKYQTNPKYVTSFAKVRKIRETDKSRIVSVKRYTLDQEDSNKLAEQIKQVIKVL